MKGRSARFSGADGNATFVAETNIATFFNEQFYDILCKKMGDLRIKIPQNTNGTFEITDRDVAEKVIADLKRFSVESSIGKKKGNDFSALSAIADRYRDEPDEEMKEVLAIADRLRNGWRG